MNKRQKVLLMIFAVALLYLAFDRGWFNLGTTTTETNNEIAGDLIEEKAQTMGLQQLANIPMLDVLSWEKDWEKDPFYYVDEAHIQRDESVINKFFGGDEGQIKNLQLTGISQQGSSAFAIINGDIVTVGDVIAGMRVEKITFNYVILAQGTKTVRLSLNE